MYVAQCSTIGQAPWCESIDENVGGLSVFCPPDHGLPATGWLHQKDTYQMASIHCKLEFDHLEHVRKNGQVLNFIDHLMIDHHLPLASSLITL